jgi:hypothetical protein
VTPPNLTRPCRRASSGQPFFADEPIGFHVDVEVDLFIHPRLGGAPREQKAEARAGCVEPAHVLRRARAAEGFL